MKVKLLFSLVATAVFMSTQILWAVSPSLVEMAAAHRWTAIRFETSPREVKLPEVGLFVMTNYDAVCQNARLGKPMRIADKEYKRGIYCHAASKIIARLPGPAKTFSATIGVDSNDQTRSGRGSIVFSVDVAGKEVYRSDVIREGMPGKSISVELGGAKELTLQVGNAADGISCDQADWAEAKVIVADGQTVWLGDLPLFDLRETHSPGLPFSFTYDGKPSVELLKTWPRKQNTRKLDDKRNEHTLSYTDPQTGLVVRCVAIEYQDFPTVEWTVYFKNTGSADTPILENIQALDTGFRRLGASEFLLHHAVGSPANGTDYGPRETLLGANVIKRIAAAGGRSTNSDWSYFNLQWENRGAIVAVGWPGQWAAEFARDAGENIRIRIGQELTHLKLTPGEEVRTPLMVMQFWQGRDWIDAQNIWRRWMMAHSMPKPGGKLPPPQLLASSSRAYGEMIGANEGNQIMHIDRYLEEGIKLDYWWMDAGWYICDGQWPKVGTWEVDRKRFPKGFKPISDHAHAKGLKILVWFEPERVHPGTWLYKERPQWLLSVGGGNKLLNLGNEEARKWLTDHVDKMIIENGIDLYRQDCNIDPLAFWRKNDAPDRQGITENKYVVGLLSYWDTLLERHPDLLIDECASGGRRNDLEMMRRAIPLWRTDHPYHMTKTQGMTYGISFWLPMHGTGTVACTGAGYYGGGKTPVEAYPFWSDVTPSLGLGIDVRIKDLDYQKLRKLIDGWREISKYYYGDYYPLTPYSLDDKDWLGWQFNDPAKAGGMVQVFRRPASIYEAARFKLRGLDAKCKYIFTELNTGKTQTISGDELMNKGLLISITEQPDAAVFVYKKEGM
ncbi:MAG: alpha-galactosidase [Pirellulales bacterium]|nr:alpha-galactosidase [Pirellulales bacterium]